jgi:hypothetical protein
VPFPAVPPPAPVHRAPLPKNLHFLPFTLAARVERATALCLPLPARIQALGLKLELEVVLLKEAEFGPYPAKECFLRPLAPARSPLTPLRKRAWGMRAKLRCNRGAWRDDHEDCGRGNSRRNHGVGKLARRSVPANFLHPGSAVFTRTSRERHRALESPEPRGRLDLPSWAALPCVRWVMGDRRGLDRIA